MRDANIADAQLHDGCKLFIGEGVTIKGEISVPETLVVCGTLEGDVSAGNLIVCETGVIRGKIAVAENAEVFGKVFEKFDVKQLLILRSTGRVDGNVSYGTLQIEQGATIAGGIASNDLGREKKPAKSEATQNPEQKPLRPDAASGNGVRGVTQLEPIGFGNPPTPARAPSAH
jgi:cytoskeletal protein CcmA (bactofilin family)